MIYSHISFRHLFFWVKPLRLWGITLRCLGSYVLFRQNPLGSSFFWQIDIGDFLPEKKWNNTLIFMWLSLDLYFWKSIYIAGLYFHLKFGILYWNAMLCIVKGIFKKWVGGLRDFYSFSNWEFFTFVPGIHGIGSNFVRLAIYTTVVSRCAVNRSFPILTGVFQSYCF